MTSEASQTGEGEALSELDKQNLTDCKKELGELLEKHGCALDVGVLLRTGKLPEAFVKIVLQRKTVSPRLVFPPGMMPPRY